MGYVLTAIAHDSLNTSQFIELKTYLETLPVKINNIVVLSKDKAYDFEVSLKLSEHKADESLVFKRVRDEILKDSFNLRNILNLIFQRDDEHRQKKLFCFDMDSTLIYQEVIELIAEYAGVQDEVEAITLRAMNGELDFKQSLAQRVLLLKGIDGTIWDDLKKKLKFTKGVRQLTKGLKKKGVTLAVLSGGFIPLAEYVKTELGLDYAFANTLGTEVDSNGKLVFDGTTVGDVVDGVKKAELTAQIANEQNISLKDTVCVGDGSNDLPMMSKAGFGIAWNAKPKVQKLAPSRLNSDSMQDIFYILGYNDAQIKELVA